MTNTFSEQEIRLEVIKALIQSGTTNMLRGDIGNELAKRADPLVAYVVGAKTKAAAKPKPSPKKDEKQKVANPQGPAVASIYDK